jgi:phenylalanyl-tRNA synthetase beta chain
VPIVNFDYDDFIHLLGAKISKEDLTEKLPMIGTDINAVKGNEFSVEFFPNRPDLLSVEGISRAMRSFLGIEKRMKKYEIGESSIAINVDPSVEGVRPFIAGAFIEGLKMDERTMNSLMDLQEKLHFSLGRDRKKMAMGVHDFDPIEPPFTYKAVEPTQIRFVPLGCKEEMSLDEILDRHDKGIQYAHLLKKFDRYPIIIDSNGKVLSFPPIINGELTAVSESTENIFIDVTGNDRKVIEGSLSIFTTALAERGGKIKKVKVNGKFFPDLSPTKGKVDVSYANKILGSNFHGREMVGALERMGYDAIFDERAVKVSIPKWRIDILHPIDLVEDIAIGYGIDKFEPSLPQEMTIGHPTPSSAINDKLKDIMIGLGFDEVMTLSLSSEEDQFDKMGIEKNEKKRIEIENPVSEEHSQLRCSLLPSLLNVLKLNKHRDLPQKIFEIGEIVEGIKNRKRLCGVEIGAKVGFTKCKSIVEAILANLGIDIKMERKEHPSFIEGRCASIVSVAGNDEIGHFGELHPRTITNFHLEHPIIAFEFDVEKMKL